MVQSLMNQHGNAPPALPADTLQRIDTLEDDVTVLGQQLQSSGSYTFETFVFHSEAELLRVLDSSIGDGHVGWYLDIVGVLTRLEDVFATGKEYADKRRAAELAKLTPLAADNMASMEVSTVLYLFEEKAGKKNPVDEDDGWGHRMESIDRYTGVKGKPVRTVITTKARDLTTKVKGSILGTGVAQRLAKHLLTEVNTQIGALTTFLTDYHNELQNECNYPSKVAWQYLGICTRAIIKHLIVPRLAVSGIEDVCSKANQTTILFAVLEVHQRMNALIACEFKSHAVLTTTMSTFVMKHRIDASQLEAVGAKCEAVSKSSSLVEKRVAVLEVSSKAASADLKFLKTKVK